MGFCKRCNVNVLTILCGNCGQKMPTHEQYHRHVRHTKKTTPDSESSNTAVDVLTETDLQKAIQANKV